MPCNIHAVSQRRECVCLYVYIAAPNSWLISDYKKPSLGSKICCNLKDLSSSFSLDIPHLLVLLRHRHTQSPELLLSNNKDLIFMFLLLFTTMYFFLLQHGISKCWMQNVSSGWCFEIDLWRSSPCLIVMLCCDLPSSTIVFLQKKNLKFSYMQFCVLILLVP